MRNLDLESSNFNMGGKGMSFAFAANKLILNALRQRVKVKKTYSTSTFNTQNLLSSPLSKPIAGFQQKGGDAKFNPHSKTRVTKLSNGLTVASEDHWGSFATLGVLTNAGSRNEVAYLGGINHFLEKLAYNSTDQFSGRQEIIQLLEKHGGICDCQSSRDTMVHAISLNKDGLETAMKILSQVVLHPQFTEEEVDLARQVIAFELENLHMNPNKELRMTELIHAAAYRHNTLGLPKVCPPENIMAIDRNLLFSYLRNQYTAGDMVLAGCGMPHEQLVELAEKYFTAPATWQSMSLDNRYLRDRSYAQYTGGVVAISEDLSNVSLGPNPMPELAHVCIGLESCSHEDEDFVAYCVLNTLMGGGGSFSAGGPGKGMYTRLYTNVLNRHHWIENATAYNHAYTDSGLFVFFGSAHPNHLYDLVLVLTSEMKRMTMQIGQEELSRAKRQLQSMLMMNLESRAVIFEDVGRQVLSTGERKPPKYFYDKIECITEDDIRRIACRLFKSPPSMSALGTLDRLPEVTLVKELLQSDKTGTSQVYA